MIRGYSEKAGDFIIFREQGLATAATVLEGSIKESCVGFSFYEVGGSVVVNEQGKKIGEKRAMHWSSFFASSSYGNIYIGKF